MDYEDHLLRFGKNLDPALVVDNDIADISHLFENVSPIGSVDITNMLSIDLPNRNNMIPSREKDIESSVSCINSIPANETEREPDYENQENINKLITECLDKRLNFNKYKQTLVNGMYIPRIIQDYPVNNLVENFGLNSNCVVRMVLMFLILFLIISIPKIK